MHRRCPSTPTLQQHGLRGHLQCLCVKIRLNNKNISKQYYCVNLICFTSTGRAFDSRATCLHHESDPRLNVIFRVTLKSQSWACAPLDHLSVLRCHAWLPANTWHVECTQPLANQFFVSAPAADPIGDSIPDPKINWCSEYYFQKLRMDILFELKLIWNVYQKLPEKRPEKRPEKLARRPLQHPSEKRPEKRPEKLQ